MITVLHEIKANNLNRNNTLSRNIEIIFKKEPKGKFRSKKVYTVSEILKKSSLNGLKSIRKMTKESVNLKID